MTRAVPALIAFALLALCVPGSARAEETIYFTNEAHAAADQAAAITAARELIASGDLNGAVAELSRWVASHPLADDAARFLGDLYYRQGKFDRAQAVYVSILAHSPRDKETHNRLGVVYAAENRIDAAIQEFNNALPGTDSIRDLVIAHLRKGDLPAYEAEMLHAAQESPTDPDIQEELGEVYETIDRPEAAELYFRRALDNAPDSIAAINGLGMTQLDLHDYSDAQSAFNHCLALDPVNYACLDNLGADYLDTAHYGAAEEAIQRARHIAPERPEAIVNTGFLADARGDWKAAVNDYVEAMSIDPYVPESYVNLGIDYEHHGLYTLAQSALLRGVSAAPYDGRIRYLLGQAYEAQGETMLALQELTAAAKSFDPDIARIAQEETKALLNTVPATPSS